MDAAGEVGVPGLVLPALALVLQVGVHADDLAARAFAVAERVKVEVPENLRGWLAREFFPLHIKMYSKSRRKAPIYWQLAAPSASYSVWLYVHAYKIAQASFIAPFDYTSLIWASLSGFLHGAPLERLRLRVGAGLRGWRFAASSAGVLDAQSTQVFSFGGAVWADGSFRVVGPLSLQAALVGAARWRPERFLVTNLGPVLELSPFSATALIGVSIRGLGE